MHVKENIYIVKCSLIYLANITNRTCANKIALASLSHHSRDFLNHVTRVDIRNVSLWCGDNFTAV